MRRESRIPDHWKPAEKELAEFENARRYGTPAHVDRVAQSAKIITTPHPIVIFESTGDYRIAQGAAVQHQDLLYEHMREKELNGEVPPPFTMMLTSGQVFSLREQPDKMIVRLDKSFIEKKEEDVVKKLRAEGYEVLDPYYRNFELSSEESS